MKRFEGRVAVITGAAGGIGRGLALNLARRGTRLALADVNAEGLAASAKAARELGPAVSSHAIDVADRDAMAALPDAVVAEHGGVHLLVNNAGVAVSSTLEEHRLEDFEWLLGVNLWGVVYGCKFFLPHLLEQDEAHIVNISSVFGFLGLPSQSAYCASKAGVKAISEALSVELSHTNVGVTSVHPGMIATDIVRQARMGPRSDADSHRQVIETFERRGMPPERAAEIILRAVERKKRRVRVGADAVLGDVAKRLFPSALHELVAWRWRKGKRYV